LQEAAALDDGDMPPVSYALTACRAPVENRVVEGGRRARRTGARGGGWPRQAGSMTPPPQAEAVARAAEEFAHLLPDGLGSQGHRFWTAYDGDDIVGMLWLRLTETSEGTTAFGYDFSVREDLRRQGYGRATLLAAPRRSAGSSASRASASTCSATTSPPGRSTSRWASGPPRSR